MFTNENIVDVTSNLAAISNGLRAMTIDGGSRGTGSGALVENLTLSASRHRDDGLDAARQAFVEEITAGPGQDMGFAAAASGDDGRTLRIVSQTCESFDALPLLLDAMREPAKRVGFLRAECRTTTELRHRVNL